MHSPDNDAEQAMDVVEEPELLMRILQMRMKGAPKQRTSNYVVLSGES